jgi:hypothetical protein
MTLATADVTVRHRDDAVIVSLRRPFVISPCSSLRTTLGGAGRVASPPAPVAARPGWQVGGRRGRGASVVAATSTPHTAPAHIAHAPPHGPPGLRNAGVSFVRLFIQRRAPRRGRFVGAEDRSQAVLKVTGRRPLAVLAGRLRLLAAAGPQHHRRRLAALVYVCSSRDRHTAGDADVESLRKPCLPRRRPR